MKIADKSAARWIRQRRARQTIKGTAARPRLSVFRSLKHFYVQYIDDDAGCSLGAVSTRDKRFREVFAGSAGNLKGAAALGKLAGELAKELKIVTVVFDRGGYQYHGRVKALAEAVRAAGIKF
jgi:large subunit ribosomal protein L18